MKKHEKIFRFEAIWLKESSYNEVVTLAWEEEFFFGLLTYVSAMHGKLSC